MNGAQPPAAPTPLFIKGLDRQFQSFVTTWRMAAGLGAKSPKLRGRPGPRPSAPAQDLQKLHQYLGWQISTLNIRFQWGFATQILLCVTSSPYGGTKTHYTQNRFIKSWDNSFEVLLNLGNPLFYTSLGLLTFPCIFVKRKYVVFQYIIIIFVFDRLNSSRWWISGARSFSQVTIYFPKLYQKERVMWGQIRSCEVTCHQIITRGRWTMGIRSRLWRNSH